MGFLGSESLSDTQTQIVNMRPERPTYFIDVNYLSPRLGIKVVKPFTVVVRPYGDDYTAQAHFLPTQALAYTAGKALDGLVNTLISRFVRLSIVKQDISPTLYDEYRTLSEHFAFA